MESESAAFLSELYQNVTMGESSIDVLVDQMEESPLRDKLMDQKKEYHQYAQKTESLLNQYHENGKTLGPLKKIGISTSIKTNTLFNKTPSHIAEMMIQGNTMGIIELNKQLNQYPGCEEETKRLAGEILKFEQQSIDSLKPYLE